MWPYGAASERPRREGAVHHERRMCTHTEDTLPGNSPPVSTCWRSQAGHVQHRLHLLLLSVQEALYARTIRIDVRHHARDLHPHCWSRIALPRCGRVAGRRTDADGSSTSSGAPSKFVDQYRRPGQIVRHTFQTNGILLDEDWCTFFKKHRFLVGLSVDGPRDLHDAYRGIAVAGTFDRVIRVGGSCAAQGRLQHLCTVTPPTEIRARGLSFLRNEPAPGGMQFIDRRGVPPSGRCRLPTWAGASGRRPAPALYQSANLVTGRSSGGTIRPVSRGHLRGCGAPRRRRSSSSSST